MAEMTTALNQLQTRAQDLTVRLEAFAEWDEASHPRGKTTPGSRGGSFAPKAIAKPPTKAQVEALASNYLESLRSKVDETGRRIYTDLEIDSMKDDLWAYHESWEEAVGMETGYQFKHIGGELSAETFVPGQYAFQTFEQKAALALMYSEKMGWPAASVKIMNGEGPEFSVGGSQSRAAGLAYIDNYIERPIELYLGKIDNPRDLLSLISHEVQHHRTMIAETAFKRDWSLIEALPKLESGYPDMIRASGELSSPELKKRFPAYAALSEVYGYSTSDARLYDKLVATGPKVSSYAARYWKDYADVSSGDNRRRAIHETLSEMAASEAAMSHGMWYTPFDGQPKVWRDTYQAYKRVYSQVTGLGRLPKGRAYVVDDAVVLPHKLGPFIKAIRKDGTLLMALSWPQILAYADEHGHVTPTTLSDTLRSRDPTRLNGFGPVLAYADAAGRVYVGWDESKHPRIPDGVKGGGRWVIAYHGTTDEMAADIWKEGLKPKGRWRKAFVTDDFDEAVRYAEARLADRSDAREPVVVTVRIPKRVWASKFQNTYGGFGRENTQFATKETILSEWIASIKGTKSGRGYTESSTVMGGEDVVFYIVILPGDSEEVKGAVKFSAYAISRPLYVHRPVLNADAIIAWAKSVGFETTLPAEDMHVTICYSKEPVDWLALDHDDVTLEVPSEGVRTLAWDESKHPRVPSGSGDPSGEFAPKGVVRSIVYHGTREEGLPEGVRFGGWHFGTKQAALDRLDQTPSLRKGGVPGAEKGFKFEIVLNKPYGSVENPITETELFGLINIKSELAKIKAKHDGIIYRNVKEDPGSISYLVFNRESIKLLGREFDQRDYADRTITNLGDDGAVVLRFESTPLAARHQYFLDHGASWDYDEYHPHITLTYDAPEGLDLKTVEPYSGPIVLGPEEFEEVEDGWAEGVKEHHQPGGHDQDTHGNRGSTPWNGVSGKTVNDYPGKTKLDKVRAFADYIVGGLPSPIKMPIITFEDSGVLGRRTDGEYFASSNTLGIRRNPTDSIERVLAHELGHAWLHQNGYQQDEGQADQLMGRMLYGTKYPGAKPIEFRKVAKHMQAPTEIDYAQIGKDLDALEAKFRDELRDLLTQSRNVLLATVRRRGGQLDKLALELKLPYEKEIQRAIRDALQRAMDRGGADAAKEVGKVKKEYTEAQGGRWITMNGRHVFIPDGETPEQALEKVKLRGDPDSMTRWREKILKAGGSKDILDSMSENELKALQDYTLQSHYEDLNRALREGTLTVEQEKFKDNLMSAIKKLPESKGQTVRGIPRWHGPAPKVGQIMEDKAFTSTSPYGNVADRFGKGRGAVLLFYRYGAGYGYQLGAFSMFSGEEETLRPPGQKYRIDKVSKAKDGRTIVYLEAAPKQLSVEEEVSELPYTTYAVTFIPTSAVKWLRIKAFWVSGVLNTGLTEDARLAIINGLKVGKPNSEIITDVARAYIPYLGDPTAVAGPGADLPTAARLETVVRTNITEAYNKGRIDTFIRPDMMPFLDGIEYSAILDSRTTPVCRFLDGKIFKPTDPELASLTPPNHFQCRSLVVPIVVGDTSWDKKNFITPAQIQEARALADVKFLEQEDYAEWDESRHRRGKTTPGSRGGSFAPVDLTAAADVIRAMSPDERDNTEIGDFPGHASGYDLYEAQKLLPKPSEKLKRITDSNSFSLWSSYEYIANVDGAHFGISKYEDPDETDDESKFVFAFKNLATHDQMTETTTSDVQELFAEIRKAGSLKKLVEEYAVDAEGHEGVWRTIRGRRTFIREGETATQSIKRTIATRSARAIDTHKPATKEKQLKAAKYEATVAKLINGKNLDDNEPFDVIVGRHAVEVKVVLSGTNAKVTMHPESLARKANFLRDEKMVGHTVVIDVRRSAAVYYYRRGVGSFRLSAMQVVKAAELKEMIK